MKDISREEFERQYFCNFAADSRYDELNKRLHKYYKDSDKMNNYEASIAWKEFRLWADCHGYTAKEINRAKHVVSGWHI